MTEAFELAKKGERPLRLNIETKITPDTPDATADAETFARLVVDAEKEAGFAQRVSIQSFDWRTLVNAKRLAPEIETKVLP